MSSNAGKTVAEILEGKKGSIKTAALPPGSPSWRDILSTPWEDIVERAKQRWTGYKTIKKLLSDPEYSK